MQNRRQLETIAGRVNSDGSIGAGDGFTVLRLAVGSYAITPLGGMRTVSITASPIGGGGNTAAVVFDQGFPAVRIITLNSAAASADVSFTFTLAGIQQ